MLIKDFLDEVCDEVNDFDEDLREKLLRLKLNLLEDKLLKLSNYIKKNHKITVPANLQVRLPYDFRFPHLIKKNDAILYRHEPSEVGTDGTKYSLEYKRLDLSESRPLVLKASDFETANIEIKRSTFVNGYGFILISADDTIKFGEILDNQNIYYPENLTNENEVPVKIVVLDTGDDVSKYQDVIRYEDNDAIEILTAYGNYQIRLMEGVKEYYLAENGFAYSDAGLTTLVSRGRLISNNLLFNFGEVEEGDVIEMEYAAAPQQYINEEQISITIDTFHDCMYKGMVYEALMTLKKTQKASMWLNQFNEALKLAQVEAGRINSMGKIKRFTRKTTKAPRLPI